jgi:hypothetical protein
MEVRTAPQAPAVEGNVGGDDRSALGAADHFSVAGHVDGARSVLGNAPGAGRGARLWGRPCRCPRLAVPIIVLIPMLPVFTVAHV